MTVRSLQQKPFTKELLRTYGQALLSSVVLLPRFIVLFVNESIQSPGLFFGGLLGYFVVFLRVHS